MTKTHYSCWVYAVYIADNVEEFIFNKLFFFKLFSERITAARLS